MQRGRILAVDYGSKNVGLACCDELRVVIRPLLSLPNKGRRKLLERLGAMVRENAIDEVVVGIPYNMDGTAGASVRRVERFIAALRGDLEVPLSKVDERLTTAEAKELWVAMTPRRQRKYRTIDSLAAAFILERFLEL